MFKRFDRARYRMYTNIQIFKYNRCNGIRISKMFDKSKCTKCSTGPDIKYTKYLTYEQMFAKKGRQYLTNVQNVQNA